MENFDGRPSPDLQGLSFSVYMPTAMLEADLGRQPRGLPRLRRRLRERCHGAAAKRRSRRHPRSSGCAGRTSRRTPSTGAGSAPSTAARPGRASGSWSTAVCWPATRLPHTALTLPSARQDTRRAGSGPPEPARGWPAPTELSREAPSRLARLCPLETRRQKRRAAAMPRASGSWRVLPQRVQPHHLVGEAVEPRHLLGEEAGSPVSRPSEQRTTTRPGRGRRRARSGRGRPRGVADAGAAVPVDDVRRRTLERLVGARGGERPRVTRVRRVPAERLPAAVGTQRCMREDEQRA